MNIFKCAKRNLTVLLTFCCLNFSDNIFATLSDNTFGLLYVQQGTDVKIITKKRKFSWFLGFTNLGTEDLTFKFSDIFDSSLNVKDVFFENTNCATISSQQLVPGFGGSMSATITLPAGSGCFTLLVWVDLEADRTLPRTITNAIDISNLTPGATISPLSQLILNARTAGEASEVLETLETN